MNYNFLVVVSLNRVAVVDANDPADVLDRFDICSSHLLCIASGECRFMRVHQLRFTENSIFVRFVFQYLSLPRPFLVPGAMESDFGVEELKSLPLHESSSPSGETGSKKGKR